MSAIITQLIGLAILSTFGYLVITYAQKVAEYHDSILALTS